MNKGKLIFVSGLTGAGKTTLVGEALNVIGNLEYLLTYTTRPKRFGEERSYEYVFLGDKEYDLRKAASNNWDETIYEGYRYAADAEKIINDLNKGVNVIVSVTPNINDIRTMARIYRTRPVTIWINTDHATATSRVKKDKLRSFRKEDETVKKQFDYLFEPKGDIRKDGESFVCLVSKIIDS